MGFFDDLGRSARRQAAPITLGVIASLTVSSLFFWISNLQGVEHVAFTKDWLSRPWTLLSYPWAYMPLGGVGIIFFLMLVFWLLIVGGSVERDMGPGRYATLWIAGTVIPALLMWAGYQASRAPVILAGPLLPVSAITIAWATRNPTAPISHYGIIPLTAMWLAWIDVAIVFFSYGLGAPWMGVLACGGLAFAYLFAADKIPGLAYAKSAKYKPSRGARAQSNEYFDDVRRREKEREEQERLRRLFEGSVKDDEG